MVISIEIACECNSNWNNIPNAGAANPTFGPP